VTAAHLFQCRVYYEDTDAAGIVYYANYLKFAERARTEILREAGIVQHDVARRDGVAFAVKSVAVEYAAPAKLDDALVVETTVSRLGGASATADQIVRRKADGTALAEMRVRLACLRLADGRPARFPADVREALARHIVVTKD
jgi:acyl-CoA thioester hydrolase